MPSVSVTDEFWSKFSTDCYWKAYRICRTQDHCKSSMATELGTAVTWASAHSSALTGGLARFISEQWRALNVFQMCWPHKTATYHSCERSAPSLYSSHPYSHASWAPGLLGWVVLYLLKITGCQACAQTREQWAETSAAGHSCTCRALAACALVLAACPMLVLDLCKMGAVPSFPASLLPLVRSSQLAAEAPCQLLTYYRCQHCTQRPTLHSPCLPGSLCLAPPGRGLELSGQPSSLGSQLEAPFPSHSEIPSHSGSGPADHGSSPNASTSLLTEAFWTAH